MRESRVCLSKFEEKRSLPNKRIANAPIMDLIRNRIAQVTPENFRAMVMPSPNLYDVEFLREHEVPDENVFVVENNPGFFSAIRLKCQCDMTDGPLDLEERVAFSRNLGVEFDWINLDLCGPINPKLFRIATTIASHKLLANNGIVTVTVKCARENTESQRFITELSQNPQEDLQGKRESALAFILEDYFTHFGPYSLNTLIKSKYREDRIKTGSASWMLSYAACFSRI